MSSSIHCRRASALFAAIAIAGAGAAYAADSPSPQPGNGPSKQHRMMGGNMMSGDMMGGDMMGMMKSCRSMMADGAMGGAAAGMPKFPPGNEKLEAQMHAEMMQKMGEIAERYAEKIKEGTQ